jgi:type II secretory pathway predicted ATPase ExeA
MERAFDAVAGKQGAGPAEERRELPLAQLAGRASRSVSAQTIYVIRNTRISRRNSLRAIALSLYPVTSRHAAGSS